MKSSSATNSWTTLDYDESKRSLTVKGRKDRKKIHHFLNKGRQIVAEGGIQFEWKLYEIWRGGKNIVTYLRTLFRPPSVMESFNSISCAVRCTQVVVSRRITRYLLLLFNGCHVAFWIGQPFDVTLREGGGGGNSWNLSLILVSFHLFRVGPFFFFLFNC